MEDSERQGDCLQRSLGAGLTLLVLLISAEVLWFPVLASALFRFFSGHGWDGSGLVYWQWFFVVPGALLFLLVVAGVVYVAAARSIRSGIFVLVIAWLADVALMILAIWLYSLPPVRRG